MKAVYIEKHGGVDQLKYGNLPDPIAGPNDVKIHVLASSVNRLDLFTRLGVRGTRLSLRQPHILGGDCAGDVVEIGSEVKTVRIGDRVVVNPKVNCNQCQFCIAGEDELCTSPGMLGSNLNGSYAEFVVVPAVNTVRLPVNLSYEQAASLPTVFLPVWNILIRKAQLKPTESVLVLSASSGVGTAAIQVAKKVVGARVITTTSTAAKADLALGLGADEVINYSKEDICDSVLEMTNHHGVNVVVDHVGSEFWPAAMGSLAPGGRYGICGVTTGYTSELQMGRLFVRNQTIFGAFLGRKQDLHEIVHAASRGVIRGVIHETFPLQEAAKAHEAMENRSCFGKLVLVNDDLL